MKKEFCVTLFLFLLIAAGCSSSDEGKTGQADSLLEDVDVHTDATDECGSNTTQALCEENGCAWGYITKSWTFGESCPMELEVCIPADLNCTQTVVVTSDETGRCWLSPSFCELSFQTGSEGEKCVGDGERLRQECGFDLGNADTP
jgi:hypothetical protein